MNYQQVMQQLEALKNPEAIDGMARVGINTQNRLGLSVPTLRKVAKEAGKNHALALQLWDSGFHDARILAGMVDDPKQVTEAQLETWVNAFDSWDVCDLCCGNLFDKTPWAYQKAVEWTEREDEFVKRAGFVMMTQLAVHDKQSPDSKFEPFFDIILREACDERNFVKKAVNWALRQIGKRNLTLNEKAIATGEQIQQLDSRAARWIASDALRELTGAKVQARLQQKAKRSHP